MTTTRREFLIATVSGLGAAALAPGCGLIDGESAPPPPDPPDRPEEGREAFPETQLDLEEMLLAYFEGADETHVATVGEPYLERFGEDTDAAVEDLSEAVRVVEEAQMVDEAIARWNDAVRSDFEAGDVVDVAGWQLAPTESRLCGLVYYLIVAEDQ